MAPPRLLLLPTILLLVCGSYARDQQQSLTQTLPSVAQTAPPPAQTSPPLTQANTVPNVPTSVDAQASAPPASTEDPSITSADASNVPPATADPSITSENASQVPPATVTGDTAQAQTSEASATAAPSVNSTPNSSKIPTTTSIANRVSVVVPTSATATSTGGVIAPQFPQIPIHPVITPGLGIAGVVFIISGMVYALVGIRNRSIYIALGSTFLTSLAVTVLVVYVASPPISNAVQGAYFVAAFLTGVILGGLSLIFKEITECLGSIFGGFCLAMWFLCLKSGGLVTSQGSRIAFIAAFCMALLAASFIKVIKNYATIGSSAFAGATVVLLGIDCFSCAGLKEFWLYIWGLNKSLFPLGTTTYPLARGIQAELACIVVVFLFGLMSQARLWKIVKQKHAERDLERLRGEQALDQLETAVGRNIESTNNRERIRWEAIYSQKQEANKSTSDYQSTTTSTSLRKLSASFKENDKHVNESVELVDLDRMDSRAALVSNTAASSGRTSVIVRIADDSMNSGTMHRQSNETNDRVGAISPIARQQSVKDAWGRDSNSHRPVSILKNKNVAPPVPAVVPLPFSVPASEGDHEDTLSMATIAETDDNEYEDTNRLHNSNRNSAQPPDEIEEDFAVDIPHIEDDRASSLAATLDDLTDDGSDSLRNLDTHSMVFADGPEETPASTLSVPKRLSGELDDETAKTSQSEAAPDNHGSVKSRSPTMISTSAIGDVSQEGPLPNEQQETSEENKVPQPKRLSLRSNQERSVRSPGPSEPSDQSLNNEALKQQLTGKVSKVALSYRTNEWAKHLETADRPSVDDLDNESPYDEPEETRFVETPAPVQIEDLQQGSTITDLRRTPTTTSTVSKANTVRAQAVDRSASDPIINRGQVQNPAVLSRSISAADHYANTIQRPESQFSMYRNPAVVIKRSSSQPLVSARGLRNDPTPILAQTLVESPVEEAQAEYSRSPSRATIGSNYNLPFGTYIPSQNINMMAPKNPAIMRNPRYDDDNMSLLSRKRMIDADNLFLAQQRDFISQQRSQQVQSPTRMEFARQNTWSVQQNPNFDSHQPQRNPVLDTQKRQAMLATWRESVRQELNPASVNLPDESRRMAMLNEHRQVQFAQQQQAAATNYRDTMFDAMMRQGSILDLHQEAMRRMQAQARDEVNRTQ